MSQQMVGIVIDRLLTDEHVRVRFTRDRLETLAFLTFLGIELTPDEIEALSRADARLWCWGSGVAGDLVH
jgi:hypothetical protein